MSWSLKVVIAAGAITAAAVGLILFSRAPEERRVEELIREAVGWANAHDKDKCVALVSRRFKADGLDYEDVCNQIHRQIGSGRWGRIAVQRIDVVVDGEHALVHLGVHVTEKTQEFPTPLRLQLEMDREEGSWKLTSYSAEVDASRFR